MCNKNNGWETSTLFFLHYIPIIVTEVYLHTLNGSLQDNGIYQWVGPIFQKKLLAQLPQL